MSRVEALRSSLGRAFAVAAVAAMIVATTGQFLPASVGAAGQITSRSITMSTSATSTAATYTLTFTPVTTAQVLIVDFCSNDPLPGDTCSFASTTVPTIASPVSSLGTASALGSGSPVHTLKVTGLTMTGGSPYTISFTSGVTNPSTNTSFYARVLTYATANANDYVPANTTGGATTVGTPTDTGGIALSTAANITITSKVFETLSYCVFQTICGTAPNLTLGDATTGALSSSTAYVNSNAQYTISTNASGGVAVVMRGTTLCRSATPSNCNTGTASQYTISSIGTYVGTANSPSASVTNNEQFGFCVDATGASGGLAGQAPYNDTINACHTGLTTGTYSGNSQFGFNDSTGSGTNNAAGSKFLQSTGAVPTYTGTFSFLGNIAPTTEAGIYSTVLNTVATGTF